MARSSDIVARIAVPFFGGFLGAIGVALVGYALGVVGVSGFFGAAPRSLTQQGLESISWGGAMWGLIPAVFLILRKGNVYLVSLVTTIIAVTYGQFVLAHSPLLLSARVVYGYFVNLTYAIILSLTINAVEFDER